MLKLAESKTISFTKQQLVEIESFKSDLANNDVEFAFTGSLLEGKAYLQGLSEIVEAVNH